MILNKYVYLTILILIVHLPITAQTSFHIVKTGDTLQSIARRYNQSVIELCEYNALPTPFETLAPGRWIWLEPGHEDWQSQEGRDIYAYTPPDSTIAPQPPPEIEKPIVPIKFVRITSEYGYRRGRMHHGIDLAAPRGTPIVATLPGVVTVSQYSRGFGNRVVIQHENDIKTVYAHCDRNVVRVGETVKQGQVIAYAGRTGRATGSHLHFEFHLNGIAVNPRRLLRDL